MDPWTIDVQPQRLQALARANRIRHVRADLKRRIADGHMSAAEVILRHRWEVESMPLAQVLTSQRQWGARTPGESARAAARVVRAATRRMTSAASHALCGKAGRRAVYLDGRSSHGACSSPSG